MIKDVFQVCLKYTTNKEDKTEIGNQNLNSYSPREPINYQKHFPVK